MEANIFEMCKQVRKAAKERSKLIKREHKLAVQELQRAEYLQFKRNHNIGDIVTGNVIKITQYGALVNIASYVALVHNSESSYRRKPKAIDTLTIGQTVNVKIISMDDERSRVSLSIKQTTPHPIFAFMDVNPAGTAITGTVANVVDYGAFIAFTPEVVGLLHGTQYSTLTIGSYIDVVIDQIHIDTKRLILLEH